MKEYICKICGNSLYSGKQEEIQELDYLIEKNKLQCAVCGGKLWKIIIYGG